MCSDFSTYLESIFVLKISRQKNQDCNHRKIETTLTATISTVETELSATETTLFATSPQY
jgi:hypothetical protein